MARLLLLPLLLLLLSPPSFRGASAQYALQRTWVSSTNCSHSADIVSVSIPDVPCVAESCAIVAGSPTESSTSSCQTSPTLPSGEIFIAYTVYSAGFEAYCGTAIFSVQAYRNGSCIPDANGPGTSMMYTCSKAMNAIVATTCNASTTCDAGCTQATVPYGCNEALQTSYTCTSRANGRTAPLPWWLTLALVLVTVVGTAGAERWR